MKTVYTYLVMDLLHEGHLLYLKNAKALAGEGGKLIIGILTDEAVMEKKPKPTLSFPERMRIAEAIKYIDIVVAQETYSPADNVIGIKPDILVESTSHDFEDIEEMQNQLEDLNIKTKIITLPYYPSQSSTDIKKKIKEE
jgi:phosphoenolpyruvate phosphomutase